MEIDEHIVVTKFGYSLFLEFEAVEVVFAYDGPLLGGARCHVDNDLALVEIQSESECDLERAKGIAQLKGLTGTY